MFCVFFFKQKTAYEMRISDWSSDVCSSDLRKFAEVKTLEFAHAFSVPLGNGRQAELWRGRIRRHHKESAARADAFCKAGDRIPHLRSEEHTSELQSLMRISYAVFCLKKKKK